MPPIWGVSDLAPALEIYANERFDTSDGKTIIPGSVLLGDFRYRVLGSVADGIPRIPQVVGIYSTEDSLDNQLATYSAFIRISGRDPIPWLEDFPVPVLTQGRGSITWTQLRIHAAGIRALRSDQVYTKQQTNDAINAAIAGVFSGAIISGTALMADGEALVTTSQVLVTSRIFAFSQDEGVTGNLRVAQADIGEGDGFIIRSTQPTDNGAVAWQIIN